MMVVLVWAIGAILCFSGIVGVVRYGLKRKWAALGSISVSWLLLLSIIWPITMVIFFVISIVEIAKHLLFGDLEDK